MLKYIPDLRGKNEIKVRDEFNSILQQNIPRSIPNDLLELVIPVTYGVGRTLFIIFLFLASLCSMIGGGLYFFNINSQWFFIATPLLLFFSLVSGGILFFGKNIFRQQAQILREGKLYKAKIGKIIPLPTRVNGYTFYRMTVILTEFTDKEVVIYDTLRSDIVDHFFKIRDEDNHIDILYISEMEGISVIPLKLIYMARYM